MKSIIRNIVSNLTAKPSFFSGVRSFQNLEDPETLPVVMLDEPLISTDALTASGYIESTYRVTLLFLNKSDLAFKQDEHDTIVNAQREIAREFIIRCQNDTDNIRHVRNARRTNLINIFDTNYSGCMLEIDLTPFNDDGRCF